MASEDRLRDHSSSKTFVDRSGSVINTNHSGAVAYNTAKTGGWQSEEAEMPSDIFIAFSPDNRLYYCQYTGCKRAEGFTHKCQLRYVSRLTLVSIFSNDFRKHIRTHTLPLKCFKCSYAAAERSDIIRHLKVAHPRLAEDLCGPIESFACSACPTKFTRKDNLQRHYKGKHASSLSS